MIRYQELRIGDYVMADNDGDMLRGEITRLNGDEKQVEVDTGTQCFWFETNQLNPLPVTEEELLRLKFNKHVNEDGTLKYMKGAFRMLIPQEGDFSRMQLWYRDETRNIMAPISLHALQNHYYELTKVFLNDESFDNVTQ
ncbi:MAG: hypothetical protein ABIP80_03915 [Ferruginibacter sp.]